VAGRILVVDDEAAMGALLVRGLTGEGYEVTAVGDGLAALEAMRAVPDIAVVDVGLPGMSGFELCRRMRELDAGIGILLLTARDAVDDRVRGLDAGADDYLTKPFDLGELVARLHALLRRSSHSDQQSDTMTVGPLTIDTARRLVFVDGERVELTKREFDLLTVLAENAGVVLSRQRLLELVWGYDFDVDTNVADVFISYLRRKLERDGLPRVIHTVRGIGYVLRDET